MYAEKIRVVYKLKDYSFFYQSLVGRKPHVLYQAGQMPHINFMVVKYRDELQLLPENSDIQ